VLAPQDSSHTFTGTVQHIEAEGDSARKALLQALQDGQLRGVVLHAVVDLADVHHPIVGEVVEELRLG
jgi:hypothetical protein